MQDSNQEPKNMKEKSKKHSSKSIRLPYSACLNPVFKHDVLAKLQSNWKSCSHTEIGMLSFSHVAYDVIYRCDY